VVAKRREQDKAGRALNRIGLAIVQLIAATISVTKTITVCTGVIAIYNGWPLYSASASMTGTVRMTVDSEVSARC
jgi:hypothetical protein